MKINNQNLIKQLHLKNEEALVYVIDEYGGLLKSVIGKNMACLKEQQEECFNDVLLAIWQNIDSFHPEKNSFKNWIAAIAKEYRRHFAAGCSKSLACRDICPMKLPTLSSIGYMNRKHGGR